MLDVGCGPGAISVGLARAVAPGDLVGVDVEQSQVDLANAAAREAGQTNAGFQVADGTHLPFPNEHFDVAHFHAVLTYLPDTTTALAEVMRVLKPGGIVGAREYMSDSCFVEPNLGDLTRVHAMFRDLLIANGGHPQMGRELGVRFNEAGFIGIETGASFEPAKGLGPFIRPAIAEQAISHGIASRDDFDKWQAVSDEVREHPGTIVGFAWGEATGRKP